MDIVYTTLHLQYFSSKRNLLSCAHHEVILTKLPLKQHIGKVGAVLAHVRVMLAQDFQQAQVNLAHFIIPVMLIPAQNIQKTI